MVSLRTAVTLPLTLALAIALPTDAKSQSELAKRSQLLGACQELQAVGFHAGMQIRSIIESIPEATPHGNVRGYWDREYMYYQERITLLNNFCFLFNAYLDDPNVVFGGDALENICEHFGC